MDIYLCINGREAGPYSVAEVRHRLSNNLIHLDDLAWREGMLDWCPVSEVLGFPAVMPPKPMGESGSNNLQRSSEKREAFSTWLEFPRLANIANPGGISVSGKIAQIAKYIGVDLQIRSDRGLVREKLYLDMTGTSEQLDKFKNQVQSMLIKTVGGGLRHPKTWLSLSSSAPGFVDLFINRPD